MLTGVVETKDFEFLVEFPRQSLYLFYLFGPLYISFTIDWFANVCDVVHLHVLNFFGGS